MSIDLAKYYYTSSLSSQNKVDLSSSGFDGSCSDLDFELPIAKRKTEILQPNQKIISSPYNTYDYLAEFEQIMTQPLPTMPDNIQELTTLVNSRVFVLYKTVPTFAEQYPFLSQRLSNSVLISMIEIAEFSGLYDIDFNQIPDSDLGAMLNIYFQTDSNYRNIIQSFCNAVNFIFYELKTAFDAFDDLIDYSKELTKIMSDLSDLTVKSLFDALVGQTKQVIEAEVKKSTSIIKSIAYDLEKAPLAIANKFVRLKNDVEIFLRPENMKTLLNRVSAMLGRDASTFDKLGLKEIEYIIHRFCMILSGVDKIFDGVLAPLTSFQGNYRQSSKVLRSSSRYYTSYAIASGAKRPSDSDISAGVDRNYGIALSEGGYDGSIILPPSVDEINGIPSWDDIRSQNNRDSRIVLNTTMSGDEYSITNMSHEGWNRTTVKARVSLLRLQKYFSDAIGSNIKLHINSGYRSPEYNRRIGGAKHSNHMTGTAFDISTTYGSFPSSSRGKDLFVDCARRAGFQGFGFYSTFIHCDLGPPRQWRG